MASTSTIGDNSTSDKTKDSTIIDPVYVRAIIDEDYFKFKVESQVREHISNIWKWASPVIAVLVLAAGFFGFTSIENVRNSQVAMKEQQFLMKQQQMNLDQNAIEAKKILDKLSAASPQADNAINSAKEAVAKAREMSSSFEDNQRALYKQEADTFDQSARAVKDQISDIRRSVDEFKRIKQENVDLNKEMGQEAQRTEQELADLASEKKEFENQKAIFNEQSHRILDAQSATVVMSAHQEREISLYALGKDAGAEKGDVQKLCTMKFISGYVGHGGYILTKIWVSEVNGTAKPVSIPCKLYPLGDPENSAALPFEGTPFEYKTSFLEHGNNRILFPSRFVIFSVAPVGLNQKEGAPNQSGARFVRSKRPNKRDEDDMCNAL